MTETALDRNMHLPHRHGTLLDRHHLHNRAEHHAIAEALQGRRDHRFTTPDLPLRQRSERSLKGLWRV